MYLRYFWKEKSKRKTFSVTLQVKINRKYFYHQIEDASESCRDGQSSCRLHDSPFQKFVLEVRVVPSKTTPTFYLKTKTNVRLLLFCSKFALSKQNNSNLLFKNKTTIPITKQKNNNRFLFFWSIQFCVIPSKTTPSLTNKTIIDCYYLLLLKVRLIPSETTPDLSKIPN